MQVYELKQFHIETRNEIKSEFEQSLFYASENRYTDQMMGAHYLLDMLERGIRTMSEEEQLARYAKLEQETPDSNQRAILVLLQRGVEIMRSSRERKL
jgi:hypothetical protein